MTKIGSKEESKSNCLVFDPHIGIPKIKQCASHQARRAPFEWEVKKIKQKEKRALADIEKDLELVKNPYLAYSGGKDSTVLSHLVRQIMPNIPHVYIDAQCSFPETETQLKYMQEIERVNLIIESCEDFIELLKKYDDLGMKIEAETMKATVYRPIRSILEKHKFDGVFLGIRAKESYNRGILLRCRSKAFFNKRDNIWQFMPLGWWTAEEIWRYIDVHNIQYNEVYDIYSELQNREELRCSYWAGETNRRCGRYAYLKYYHPELFNRLQNKVPAARFFV